MFHRRKCLSLFLDRAAGGVDHGSLRLALFGGVASFLDQGAAFVEVALVDRLGRGGVHSCREGRGNGGGGGGRGDEGRGAETK